MNILDKPPKAERVEASQQIRAIWFSKSEETARKLAVALIRDFRRVGYDRASECLERNLDANLTFLGFPKAHWGGPPTTNVVESVFGSAQLRTEAAELFNKTKSGVWLIYQIVGRLWKRWRRLRSSHLCSCMELHENIEENFQTPAV